MTRRPLFRIQPSFSSVGMPIAIRLCTARGVSPSPHTFSRGNVVFSSTSTSSPAWAR